MFNFIWPWLFLILPLPLLIYFFIPRAKQEDAALRVPFYQRAQQALGQSSSFPGARSWPGALMLTLIWLALVSAAARPQWTGEPITLPTAGRDLLVAVDFSGSMETRDMVIENQQIPRILVVKHIVGQFLERRENDRIGLIIFGSNAYLQSPLTFDRKTVNRLLQEAQLGFAGEKTAIGDAIGLAVKRLRDRPEAQRVLIILTDGANTAGEVDPRKAADLAKQADVKIYTVGVGADEMTVQGGFFGGFNRRINPSADLDEDTLRYIADTTGGLYFRARNPQELEAIYHSLDQYEPIDQDAEVFRPSKTLFYWPLSLALFASFLLALTRLIPQRQKLSQATPARGSQS